MILKAAAQSSNLLLVSEFITDPNRNLHAFRITRKGNFDCLGLAPSRMFLLFGEDGKKMEHPETKQNLILLAKHGRLWWTPTTQDDSTGCFYYLPLPKHLPAASSSTSASSDATPQRHAEPCQLSADPKKLNCHEGTIEKMKRMESEKIPGNCEPDMEP